MEFIVLCVCTFICFINTLIIFFLGAYVVRSDERNKQMFSELISAIMNSEYEDKSVLPNMIDANSKKTWDEKYEEELESFSRRIRADSGLADLPYPNVTKES